MNVGISDVLLSFLVDVKYYQHQSMLAQVCTFPHFDCYHVLQGGWNNVVLYKLIPNATILLKVVICLGHVRLGERM